MKLPVVVLALGLIVIVAVIGVFLYTHLGNFGGEAGVDIAVYDKWSWRSLNGTTVQLYDLNQNLIAEAKADENGIAHFNVEKGSYFVYAKAPGYEEEWTNVSISEVGSQMFDVGLEQIVSCEENWTCTDWSECVDGIQTRECTDLNECGTTHKKPNEKQTCIVMTCSSNSDCNDGNPCTMDKCINGTSCAHINVTKCKSGDGCCPKGCNYIIDTDCRQCTSSADCEDKDECTINVCVSGFCQTTWPSCGLSDGCCPPGCSNDPDCTGGTRCASNPDCDDNNPCTTDECDGGVCKHTSMSDGASCGTGKICCSGQCVSPECSADSDCGTNDECTTYTCSNPGTCSAECKSQTKSCSQTQDGCCPTGCSQNPQDPNYDYDCANCQDECDVGGEARCVGDTKEVCGYWDADPCLDWGNSDDCSDCSCSCGSYTSGGNEATISCSDTIDNDCDGLTDCDDPDCSGDPACGGQCVSDGGSCTQDSDCCSGNCDDETGVCFSCASCSGVTACSNQETNECEEQCGASPECDDVTVDSASISGDTCFTCIDCEYSADTTVDTCTCDTTNCANGYCQNSTTCYYGVTCTTSGWSYEAACSTADSCGTNSLVTGKSCSGSGCGGTTYTCSDTSHTNCQSVTCGGSTYHCTYDGSWAWRTSVPTESTSAGNCNDGIDNDCDGKTDSNDPGCVDADAYCKDICVNMGCGFGVCSSTKPDNYCLCGGTASGESLIDYGDTCFFESPGGQIYICDPHDFTANQKCSNAYPDKPYCTCSSLVY